MNEIEYYTCTAAAPWTKDKGARAIHPNAVDLGNDSDDCCIRYRCPWCGLHFKVEMAQ